MASCLPSLSKTSKDPDVWLINRQVVAFFERYPVKLSGGVEDAIDQDVIKLEVRFDLRFVEGITRLSHFLANRKPNPRKRAEIHLSSVSINFCISAASLRALATAGGASWPEQFVDRADILAV
jgi:hypothetical protein